MGSSKRRADRAPAPDEKALGRFFWPAAAVAFAAMALRLLHLWQIRHAPFFSVLLGDAKGYDEWARRLAAGDWIGTDVFYQAPLYPYFLGVVYAIAGHSLMTVRVVQAAIGSASCVLLALAGRRFFSPRVGLTAGLMLAVYAPAIFFDGVIQKSVLDVFFISLSLWLVSRLVDRAHRTSSWLWLGMALGALSLTRENALLLVVVIAVWAAQRTRDTTRPEGARIAGWRATVAPLAAFILGLALVLVPVAVRNYALGGGFYLTTSQFGPNFYIGNNPKADGTYVALKEGRGAQEYERADATELAQRAAGHPLTPAQVSSYWTGQALRYITSHPGAWLKVMGRKFVLLWNTTEAVDTESQQTYAEWSLPLAALGWIGHFGVLVPLAILGGFAAWSDRRRLWVLYALTLAYAASVLAFYVVARYRYPLVPLLMLFAADGVMAAPAVFRASASPAGRRRFAVATAVVVAAVFTNWPVLSAASMRAVTEVNLGAELQAQGRLDEAIAHYRRAAELDPSSASPLLNLGTALRAQRRTSEAIDVYRRVLSIHPGDSDAHYNLANALMDAHRTDEALTHFAFAAQANPSSADIQNNFGIALAEAGKPEEAAAAFTRAIEADPRSAKAHKNLADVLDALGRRDQALQHLRAAADLAPQDASLHYDLASTLLEAKKLPDAEAEFRRALAIDSSMAEAHNNLGATLALEGKTDEAVAEFQQALTLNPGAKDAQQNLAAVLKAGRQK